MNRSTLKLFVILIVGYLFITTTDSRGQMSPCEQFPLLGSDNSQSLGVVVIEIPPPLNIIDTIFVTGPTIIQRSDPMVDPVTGDHFIETEIVEMQLQGTGQRLGHIVIQQSFNMPSLGEIRDVNPDPYYDFPAESYFEVFIEVFTELPVAPVLHNEIPLRISTVIDCIPPYGNPYEHELETGGIPLVDPTGVTVAFILQAAHKLENPLFSVVPAGNLDLTALGPFTFPGRAFFGGGIVEPEVPNLGWPPIGRIAPPLLGLDLAGGIDNLNALSFGNDQVEQDPFDIVSLSFSVDNASAGIAGTSVDFEVVVGTDYGAPDLPAPPEHIADVFYSPLTGMNFLLLDEKDPTCNVFNMTVTNSVPTASNCTQPGNPPGWPGGPNPEDTDALEFSNIFFVGKDTDFDGDLDLLNGNVFFSIDPNSASVGITVPDFRPGTPDGVATPDDILMAPPPGGLFGVYASGILDIGLLPGDDLDALCLFDADSIGFLDPGTDIALFSLAPGSPSLGGSPADIFYTDFTGSFSLTIPAALLGLLSGDNVDAMDCQILIDSTTTGVEPIQQGSIPKNFKLNNNYPNPFNPSTTIKFSIPQTSYVTLEVFNTLGERIGVLASEELSAGTYKYNWDASDLTSGIYFYKIHAGNFVETKKMILLK